MHACAGFSKSKRSKLSRAGGQRDERCGGAIQSDEMLRKFAAKPLDFAELTPMMVRPSEPGERRLEPMALAIGGGITRGCLGVTRDDSAHPTATNQFSYFAT